MPPSPLFINPETGAIDTTHALEEAIPIARLIITIVGVSLIPFALASMFNGSVLGIFFAVTAQVTLAIGSGLVLMYVISRALQLTSDQ